MKKERRFTDPHEVPSIPGTEGWEEMYPYYYLFGKGKTEREKYESGQLWFYDGVHYPVPMHLHAGFSYLHHSPGDFPAAESCAQRTLSLPCFPGITGEQVSVVADTIKGILENHRQ